MTSWPASVDVGVDVSVAVSTGSITFKVTDLLSVGIDCWLLKGNVAVIIAESPDAAVLKNEPVISNDIWAVVLPPKMVGGKKKVIAFAELFKLGFENEEIVSGVVIADEL